MEVSLTMQIARDLLELQQVDLGILRDRKAIDAIPQAAQIQEVRVEAEGACPPHDQDASASSRTSSIEEEDNDEPRARR